jgi:hypothetical protein
MSASNLFRNYIQRAAVCDRLVAGLHSKGVRFTENGCSVSAFGAQKLDKQDALVLELARAIWSGGQQRPVFSDLFLLSADNLRLVGYLLQAMADGHAAVDRWLANRALDAARSVGRGEEA